MSENKAPNEGKTSKVTDEERDQIKAELKKEYDAKFEELKSLLLSKEPKTEEIGGLKRTTMIETTEIPDGDMLTEPVHYFAWGRYHGLFGYKERGQNFNPPYDSPIELRPRLPIKGRNANGELTRKEWCSVTIWSKKQKAFIENHPEFKAGIILKSSNELHKTDLSITNQKMKAVMEVARMSHPEIVQRLTARGLKTSEDFQEMQMQLIDAIAKDSLQGQFNMSNEIALRHGNEAIVAKK